MDLLGLAIIKALQVHFASDFGVRLLLLEGVVLRIANVVHFWPDFFVDVAEHSRYLRPGLRSWRGASRWWQNLATVIRAAR